MLEEVAAAGEPTRRRLARPITFEGSRLEPLAWESAVELAVLTEEAAYFSAKPDPRRKDA